MAVGEGEAAGEGLVTGLGLVAGGAAVSVAGEAAVVGGGVVVAGVFELAPESQPTAKAIASMVGRSRAMRPASFIFGLLIIFPRSSKIEKRDDD